jgi:hypothetical protein
LSARVFIELTQHHLSRAQALVSLWEGALERANTQVQRLDKSPDGLTSGAKAGN